MITRLELDGFKTFQDFKLELGPFQVIVGANGTGKSNLFDALRLLSRLADADLRSAFQDLRGEAGELFTILPNGETTNRIRLAVELFVEREVRDSWGAQEHLKHTRLRYELVIERRKDVQGLERLYVVYESLTAIRREDDLWIKRHIGKARTKWLPVLRGGRPQPFISTDDLNRAPTIALHQDGHGGGRKLNAAERVERTVLSSVINTEFPHVFAAREEMRSWRFLQLNPEELRKPSPMLADPFVAPDGSNLPSALARMEAEDSLLLHDVARDMANLVPGIVKIEVEKDQAQSRYIVQAHTQDGREFSSRVLSDGTLRLLALVTLNNDPAYHGVLCFEEPENGVHPRRLEAIAQLLRQLSTDLSDVEQAEAPLRQLLVNTHSPVFISQLNVLPYVLFAHTVTHVAAERLQPAMRITRVVPVDSNPQLQLNLGIDKEESLYTLAQVTAYLSSADVGEAISNLREGVAA